MKWKLPKWQTIMYRTTQIMVVLPSIMGLVVMWIDRETGQAFLGTASSFFVLLAYLEIRKLKDWGEHNLSELVRVAEISARAAYKLKQRGGSVAVNGKEIN